MHTVKVFGTVPYLKYKYSIFGLIGLPWSCFHLFFAYWVLTVAVFL